jgi:hypothetical protein
MRRQKSEKKRRLERKLKEYKSVLSKDEDWDWTYILSLLKYKLERTRKCISSNKIIKDAPKVSGQIREVENLLNRVIEDRYFDEISKDFRKKYGHLKMISQKPIPGQLATTVTFKFTKETPQNAKRIHSLHHRLYLKAQKMQKDDLREAFNLMHKNIWGWWD